MLMHRIELRARRVGECDRVGDIGVRIERDADGEPERARRRSHAAGILGRLDVEGDRVGARRGELGEVVGRVGDHQVAVDHAAGVVDHRRDRPQHDGPDRHRRDEVPVTDVEVEDPAACLEQRLDLRAEAREVGGVQRRRNLARSSHPGFPSHCTILRPPTATRPSNLVTNRHKV